VAGYDPEETYEVLRNRCPQPVVDRPFGSSTGKSTPRPPTFSTGAYTLDVGFASLQQPRIVWLNTGPPDGREAGPQSTAAPSLLPAETPKPSGKAPKAKFQKAEAGSGDVPADGQPNAGGSRDMSGAESQTSAVSPAQPPSLEEVLAAIQDMPCQLGADGCRTAPKGAVMAACTLRGIKLEKAVSREAA
jgi:hypothetical protein